MKAFRANDLPIIDGEVINDPAWKSILSASGFVQQSPDEGKSATEKTEVKIGARKSGNVEILSGLNVGDLVAAEGLKKIRPMGKIKPINNKPILI